MGSIPIISAVMGVKKSLGCVHTPRSSSSSSSQKRLRLQQMSCVKTSKRGKGKRESKGKRERKKETEVLSIDLGASTKEKVTKGKRQRGQGVVVVAKGNNNKLRAIALGAEVEVKGTRKKKLRLKSGRAKMEYYSVVDREVNSGELAYERSPHRVVCKRRPSWASRTDSFGLGSKVWPELVEWLGWGGGEAWRHQQPFSANGANSVSSVILATHSVRAHSESLEERVEAIEKGWASKELKLVATRKSSGENASKSVTCSSNQLLNCVIASLPASQASKELAISKGTHARGLGARGRKAVRTWGKGGTPDTERAALGMQGPEWVGRQSARAQTRKEDRTYRERRKKERKSSQQLAAPQGKSKSRKNAAKEGKESEAKALVPERKQAGVAAGLVRERLKYAGWFMGMSQSEGGESVREALSRLTERRRESATVTKVGSGANSGSPLRRESEQKRSLVYTQVLGLRERMERSVIAGVLGLPEEAESSLVPQDRTAQGGRVLRNRRVGSVGKQKDVAGCGREKGRALRQMVAKRWRPGQRGWEVEMQVLEKVLKQRERYGGLGKGKVYEGTRSCSTAATESASTTMAIVDNVGVSTEVSKTQLVPIRDKSDEAGSSKKSVDSAPRMGREKQLCVLRRTP